jgi:cytidine deaminase
VTGPCATCRQEIEHLIALDRAIHDLRAKHRTHRSVRSVLAEHITAAGKAARRHRKHRHANHLATHAERRAA